MKIRGRRFPALKRGNTKSCHRLNRGFSLIELMVVLTIVGILVRIGISTYSSAITSSNISSESNALWGDLQYAHSQSIKQGLTVTLCAANTSGNAPYTCSGSSTTWSSGWVTYTGSYTTTSGAVTQALLLRVQQPLLSSYTMKSTSTNALSSISFNSFGFSTIRGSVTVSPPSTSSVSSKTVCISAVGSLQIVLGGDSACP